MKHLCQISASSSISYRNPNCYPKKILRERPLPPKGDGTLFPRANRKALLLANSDRTGSNRISCRAGRNPNFRLATKLNKPNQNQDVKCVTPASEGTKMIRIVWKSVFTKMHLPLLFTFVPPQKSIVLSQRPCRATASERNLLKYLRLAYPAWNGLTV